MGSAGRQIRRKKERKEKKAAKKNLKKALNAVAGLPTNCSGCKKNFIFEEHADSWQVCAEPGAVMLLCGNCFGKDT
tara:strand:+ start:19 stop:246 length:228 start_codon:yes stop_codon:yes gene_type:complete